MRRGNIVTVADVADDAAGRPRPALIVQADAFNLEHATATICLITSDVTGHALFRVPLSAGDGWGLPVDGEIAVDRLQTVRRAAIGRRLGEVSDETMFAVDQALRRWLAL